MNPDETPVVDPTVVPATDAPVAEDGEGEQVAVEAHEEDGVVADHDHAEGEDHDHTEEAAA